MILVTGATGQFGKSAIDFLLKNGISANRIAALVRAEEKSGDLKEKGIVVRKGDYANYASLVSAFEGVEKLLFVSGSDVANRSTQHENVVKAASEAGVKHVVYTSFLSKDETEKAALWIVAESHLKTETWLKESGMAYTLLKNSLYMDFVPAFVGENVLENGTIYLPAGNGKVGAALRSEMAEAAANILSSEGHEGKTYHFASNEAFTYTDVARHISALTGKPITYISPSAEEYVQTLTGLGVPADYIGLFAGFAVAQAQGELELVSTDLEHLLGRKPTSLKTFLSEVYGASAN